MKLAAAAAAFIFLGLACLSTWAGSVQLALFWAVAFLWAGLYAMEDE